MSGSLMSPFQPTVVRGFCGGGRQTHSERMQSENAGPVYLAGSISARDQGRMGGRDAQVGAHDDQKVAPFRDLGFEQLRVLDRLLGRVD